MEPDYRGGVKHKYTRNQLVKRANSSRCVCLDVHVALGLIGNSDAVSLRGSSVSHPRINTSAQHSPLLTLQPAVRDCRELVGQWPGPGRLMAVR